MTMKTLLHHSLLIFSLCVISSCRVIDWSDQEVNCNAIGGTTPVPIYNSPYTILPNGSLCCPKYVGEFCEDEKQVESDKCRRRGLVPEPCHFCKTCAKAGGEPCGGQQNIYGTCDKGLECVESDRNSTHGICYGIANKQVGEECDGSYYGTRGRCLQGLTCTVVEVGKDVRRICLNESTVPGACFKNCQTRKHKEMCGNDGRKYNNSCALRQQNCVIPEGRTPEKIKTALPSVCEQACEEVDLQSHQHAVVTYSYGVVNGSEATVACKEGYVLISNNDSEIMTLRCTNRQWLRVVTNDDGSEELKQSWRVLCYPSPQPELTLDTSSNDQ